MIHVVITTTVLLYKEYLEPQLYIVPNNASGASEVYNGENFRQ